MGSTHDTESGATVLLLDDEELLRRLLSRMLVEAGFGVIEAEKEAMALKTARRIDGPKHSSPPYPN